MLLAFFHADRKSAGPAQGDGAPRRPGWWRTRRSREHPRIAHIRRWMSRQASEVADDQLRSTLQARIASADGADALWLLRQDLLDALVAVHGEALARRRLTDVTFLFAGLLDRRRDLNVAPEHPSRPGR